MISKLAYLLMLLSSVVSRMKTRHLWIGLQKANCVLPSTEFSAALLPDVASRCCASEVKVGTD